MPKIQNYFQNNPQYKSDKVYQAVNVDMEDWKEEIHRLFDFLPTCFTRNNGLNYLRNIHESLELLDRGQQDFQGLSQVNINHGPGDCVWTIIDANYIDKLFSITPDLFRKEGRWYVNIEFFLKNQIPVRQVIQKGDILIIGAGCFQAKNIGNSIHTSFNFLMVDEFSIQQIYKRQNRNDFFRFQDVIAIRNLFLDIYIHEKLSILQNYLKYFIDQEFRRQLSKINQLTLSYLYLQKMSQFVLNAIKKSLYFQFIKDWVYYCPDCYVDYEKVIYMKYSIIQLKYLIQADNIQCSKLLCSNYVGESNCALKQIIQEQVQLSEEEDNSSIFESRKFLDEFIVGLNMESLNSHLQNGVSQQQDVLSNDTRQVQKQQRKSRLSNYNRQKEEAQKVQNIQNFKQLSTYNKPKEASQIDELNYTYIIYSNESFHGNY